MVSRIAWFIGLLLFWLAVSGSADIQHVLMGAGVSWIALNLRDSILRRRPGPANAAREARSSPLRPPPAVRLVRALSYAGFLLVEIVKANIHVALIVLNPRLPISPAFLQYRPSLRTDWARVLMGNSITLTPGTLTVELEDGRFLIHTLTRDAARSLPGCPAEGRIGQLEGPAEGGSGDV